LSNSNLNCKLPLQTVWSASLLSSSTAPQLLHISKGKQNRAGLLKQSNHVVYLQLVQNTSTIPMHNNLRIQRLFCRAKDSVDICFTQGPAKKLTLIFVVNLEIKVDCYCTTFSRWHQCVYLYLACLYLYLASNNTLDIIYPSFLNPL